jgi:hypothetical protein
MDTTIFKIGYRSGLTAFIATASFVIVQLLQLIGVLKYPWDEISIYATSLCITIPFLMAMLALHYITPPGKKYWSHLSVLFTVMYVVFVMANYVVQLATVIPATLQGKQDEVKLLIQTPHSLFWDFDAIGYILMGLAALFALPLFEKAGFQNKVRLVFLLHTLTTPLIAFVYFYPEFSVNLLLLGLPWAITAPAFMLMLALFFKKHIDGNKTNGNQTI